MSEDHLQSNSRSLWFRIGIYENHHYSQFSGFFNILMHSLFASHGLIPGTLLENPQEPRGSGTVLVFPFFPTGKGSCLVLETNLFDLTGTYPQDLYKAVE